MLTSRVPAYLLQAVRAAGKCETVFKGFSSCLLQLGENMANYPQELDEKEKPPDHLHVREQMKYTCERAERERGQMAEARGPVCNPT